MTPCTEVEEKIAFGFSLTAEESRHAMDCGDCAAVAQEWSRLEGVLDELRRASKASPAAFDVPAGFADRVMARLPAAPAGARLLDRRWAQIVLAHLGALVTLVNIVRFVAGLLVPSTSLGAVR
jgi:hypothetical protein